jgi:phosphohistidine phosphatase SixA
VEKLTLSRALGQGYSLEAVLEMLAVFNPDDTILCVGHDPDLCELAAALLGMAEAYGIKFPKSGIMGIEFPADPAPGAGVLRFFYRPEDLVALL